MTCQQWFTDESTWVQGALTSDCGKRKCLLAALADAYHGTVYGLMLGRLREACAKLNPNLNHFGSVAEFNDNKATTFADIQKVVKLANV